MKYYKNETLEKSLNALKGGVNWANTESVAQYFYKLNKMAKEINNCIEETKAILLERKETIIFPEYEEKVYFQEGSDKSEINAEKLGKYLIKNKREKEFLSVVSVTEKSLKELPDSPILLAKFKEINGKKTDIVGVKKMSKDELKKLYEGK